MRSLPAVPAFLLLVALVPSMATAQSVDLPEFTPEQRWERASAHVTLFGVAMLRLAAEEGKTAEAVGEYLAEMFGPGWSATTPLAMARGIRLNWHMWPGVDWRLEESTDQHVTFRVNRPYRALFGESGSAFGVSIEDYEASLRVFHERIAERLGMEYHQIVADDWVSVTIRTR
jgi:hypothetical protein